MHLKSNILTRLLRPGSAGTVELSDYGLRIDQRDRQLLFPPKEITRSSQHAGWWGSSLLLETNDPQVPFLQISGLPSERLSHLRAQLAEHAVGTALSSVLADLDRLVQQDCYLSHHAWKAWERRASPLVNRLRSELATLPLSPPFKAAADRLLHVYDTAENFRAERNARFTAREEQTHSSWFDRLERYPLTNRQREAIICEEDNTLVVAGAGTGKTSTIVGKAGYLLHRGLAKPHEILLLAFARKARDELAERVEQRFGAKLTVRTFHSLGLAILAETQHVVPSLSPLSEDASVLCQAIERFLEDAFKDERSAAMIRKFFVRFRYPHKSEFEFKTAHRFYQYLKGQGLVTLRGERVKSYGEMVVADFLTNHGVRYEYETPYAFATATRTRRQYKPDFFLPDFGIYIEYFGVDRQQHTAPYINRREYLDGMEWKRQTHHRFGTKLVECFFYELTEHQLEAALSTRLKSLGVSIEPITGEAFLEVLKPCSPGQKGELSRLSSLLSSFLALYKANNWTMPDLRAKASVEPSGRSSAFLDMFEIIMARYFHVLAETKEIDFHDMIAQATGLVEKGQYCSPFRYIIVDEFQDISRGRAQLLQALLNQRPDRHLFCVGDDWQAIYRFAGSDISIMTRFQEQFGKTRRIDLDRTFRYPQELLELSSRFVLKNPQQLKKALRAHAAATHGVPVKIVVESPSDEQGAGLRQALQEITDGEQGALVRVLVLGRYHFSLPEHMHALRGEFPTLQMDSRTIHTAKGLEAHYVVVLDVNSGRYGFPTEVTDDPVLNMVLAADGGFPNSEERRLFYVAITRAMRRAYLVTTEGKRSPFVEELATPDFNGLVEMQAPSTHLACPLCEGGSLIKRRSEIGMFWGCSNYPYCEGKAPTCPSCHAGAFIRQGNMFRCSTPKCSESAEACPQCRDGVLKRRTSQYGPFLGCSNWAPEGISCAYKRDLRRR